VSLIRSNFGPSADVGGLQVYELLLRLLSPSFGWNNWTSTINSHVLIHPEYAMRDPWPGRRETSDIRYNDTERLLTRHLINAGYLDGNVWSEATPEYLIEVKTTTGDCGDRFFMSSNQYRMVSSSFKSFRLDTFADHPRCKTWPW
jgi:hypothetical protein